MKERYGFISVFDEHGNLLGYVPNIYKSRLQYVRNWLNKSYRFYKWHHFVLWIDKKKSGVFYK